MKCKYYLSSIGNWYCIWYISYQCNMLNNLIFGMVYNLSWACCWANISHTCHFNSNKYIYRCCIEDMCGKMVHKSTLALCKINKHYLLNNLSILPYKFCILLSYSLSILPNKFYTYFKIHTTSRMEPNTQHMILLYPPPIRFGILYTH